MQLRRQERKLRKEEEEENVGVSPTTLEQDTSRRCYSFREY